MEKVKICCADGNHLEVDVEFADLAKASLRAETGIVDILVGDVDIVEFVFLYEEDLSSFVAFAIPLFPDPPDFGGVFEYDLVEPGVALPVYHLDFERKNLPILIENLAKVAGPDLIDSPADS